MAKAKGAAKKKAVKKKKGKKKAARKPAKKEPARPRSVAEARANSALPSSMPPREFGEFPQEGPPDEKARYLFDLLNAYAQQGTPEGKRVRQALLDAIEQFNADCVENKDKAALELTAKLFGIEAGILELIIFSTQSMSKKIADQAHRLGPKTKAGYKARTASNALAQMAEAMTTMLRAKEEGKQELHAEASEKMKHAKKMVEAIMK